MIRKSLLKPQVKPPSSTYYKENISSEYISYNMKILPFSPFVITLKRA